MAKTIPVGLILKWLTKCPKQLNYHLVLDLDLIKFILISPNAQHFMKIREINAIEYNFYHNIWSTTGLVELNVFSIFI